MTHSVNIRIGVEPNDNGEWILEARVLVAVSATGFYATLDPYEVTWTKATDPAGDEHKPDELPWPDDYLDTATEQAVDVLREGWGDDA
jgi:hypothetical protein